MSYFNKLSKQNLIKLISLIVVNVLITINLCACGETITAEKSALADALASFKFDESDTYVEYFEVNKANSDVADIEIPLITSETIVAEGDKLPIEFTVQKSGLYRLQIKVKGGGKNLSAYNSSLTLNGEIPYSESEQIYFPKQWITVGDYDNNTQPELEENVNYECYAYSNKGFSTDELYWYLSEGINTIILTADNQPIEIIDAEFQGYDEFVTEISTPKATNAENIIIQAEYPTYRSDPSILEQIDRISAATIPVCDNAATYNTLGGNSWKTLGQSVTWTFKVEKEGWYCLNLRARQDYSSGTVSGREVMLDDRPLTSDDSKITVPYASGFKRVTLTNENGETLWTYLSKGEHKVTISCTLGESEPALATIQQSVSELNRIYRRIIMITGTDPDDYRDYHLADKIPDVFDDLKVQRECLETAAKYLEAVSNNGDSDTSAFKKLIRQLDEFIKDADEVPKQISTLNSNISALGTWVLERTQQPLEIDWLEWQPYGKEAKDINCSFLKQLSHDCNRIFKSYVEDYDTLSENNTETTIDLWVVSGRDQAQIIQDLSRDFSAENSIPVNVKLVTSDSIMPATVAGIGPDVTVFNSPASVLSYALRDALVDLSKFDGFDEVISDFHESAITPYRFNDGVWAIPETESFPMLFYRSDILEELEIDIPQTWDDVYDSITTLQKNNMTFGCPGYEVFLYQNNGAYYKDNGATSLFNSEESVTAYRIWTKFYTNFDLPETFNFLNRFRTGEMPLAVVDYSNYNSLVVFAPEIKDSWGMTMVPGTKNSDGTINRSVNSVTTGAMILKNCKNIDNAWEFVKWWTSGETISQYARTLETNLGTSARVMVASKEAFDNQMWTTAEKKILNAQWEYTVGTPEVAGGYLVGRHVNNAFRKIVHKDSDIRETLNDYTKIIDKELTLKREEYGLVGDD